jgi:hypothetical protein
MSWWEMGRLIPIGTYATRYEPDSGLLDGLRLAAPGFRNDVQMPGSFDAL